MAAGSTYHAPVSSTSLTIERYAEVRAEMEAGRLRDEVLARAGITVDAWTDMQRQWLEKMGAELELGRFELTNRYTQVFLERQRELRASTQVAAEVRQTATPAEAPAAGPPLPSVSPVLPSLPASVPDTWAVDPEVSAPRLPHPAAVPWQSPLAGTQAAPLVAFADISQALPFRPPEDSPSDGERHEAPPPSGDPDTIKTALRPPSLEQWGQGAPWPSEEEEGEVEPEELRTAPARLGSRAPVLPFGPPATPEWATGSERLVVTAASGAGLKSLLEATTAPSLEVAASTVLPFRKRAEDSGLTPPPPPPPAPPTPPVALSVPSGDSLDAVLPLARYASLCAELAVFPQASEVIFQRYGLESQQKRAAVDAAWKERLHGDEKQYMAWEEMYRRYYVYWTKRGTSPAG